MRLRQFGLITGALVVAALLLAIGRPTGRAVAAGSAPTATVRDLGEFLPGWDAIPQAINANGDVVGLTSTDVGTHTFFWSEATGAEDLGSLGGTSTYTWAFSPTHTHG
jgi:probable HAF family extracellular repeat protein